LIRQRAAWDKARAWARRGSGAGELAVAADPVAATLTVVDDGSGMQRRDLARYHDVAASSKARGQGIGFAGVGIKLGLLACEEVLTETRRGKTHVASSWRLASAARRCACGYRTRARRSSIPASSKARCAGTSIRCSTPLCERSWPSTTRAACGSW